MMEAVRGGAALGASPVLKLWLPTAIKFITDSIADGRAPFHIVLWA